jgi:hypothetical protein
LNANPKSKNSKGSSNKKIIAAKAALLPRNLSTPSSAMAQVMAPRTELKPPSIEPPRNGWRKNQGND